MFFSARSTRAVPSSTTGLSASCVATTQRGSSCRLRTLRDFRLLENHNARSSHIPHTGIAWGRPSGHTVTTQ
jgi:hypothetical protein